MKKIVFLSFGKRAAAIVKDYKTEGILNKDIKVAGVYDKDHTNSQFHMHRLGYSAEIYSIPLR